MTDDRLQEIKAKLTHAIQEKRYYGLDKDDAMWLQAELEASRQRANELQAENAQLRAALQRFATQENWDNDSVGWASGDPVVVWLGYDDDPWVIAQAALEGGQP